MGSHLRDRRKYDITSDTDISGDEESTYQGSGALVQVALRDKEEVLVERALERIRRAQALGKQNVQLTPSERDALERKMQSDQRKGKRSALKTKSSDERRTKGRSSGSVSTPLKTAAKRSSRPSLTTDDRRQSESPIPTPPPGFVVAGPDGHPVFSPLGYYAQPQTSPYGPSSRSESRSGSSHSLHYSPPLPQGQFRGPKPRYFSVPEQQLQASGSSRPTSSSRPMPDDPNWQPRARSSSTLSYATAPDHHQYQAYAPPMPQLPQQYAPTRRIVSGPPNPGYPTLNPAAAASAPYSYASSSDPSLPRHPYLGGGEDFPVGSEDEFDEDEDDHGVLVDVAPHEYGQGYDVKRSSYRRTGR